LGVTAVLHFKGGEQGTFKSATLTTDLRVFQENTASIAGSKGRIKV